MKAQDWIFSVRCPDGRRLDGIRRCAIVGPARASTVEAVLHLAEAPEAVRVEIRTCAEVRDFVNGRLDPDKSGYYAHSQANSSTSWVVCIGPVQEVLSR